MNTIARDIQLEEIRVKRKRTQWRKQRTIEEDKPAYVTLDEFIEEVRRIAMGGICPTTQRFNFCKPVKWDTAEVICTRFNMTWDDVALEAGLKRGRL